MAKYIEKQNGYYYKHLFEKIDFCKTSMCLYIILLNKKKINIKLNNINSNNEFDSSRYFIIKNYALNKEHFSYYDPFMLELSCEKYHKTSNNIWPGKYINILTHTEEKPGKYIIPFKIDNLDSYITKYNIVTNKDDMKNLLVYIKLKEDTYENFYNNTISKYCNAYVDNNNTATIIQFYVGNAKINHDIGESFIKKTRIITNVDDKNALEQKIINCINKIKENPNNLHEIIIDDFEQIIINSIDIIRENRDDIHEMFIDEYYVNRIDSGNEWYYNIDTGYCNKVLGLPKVNSTIIFSTFLSASPIDFDLDQAERYYSIGSILYKIMLPLNNKNWAYIGPCNGGGEVLIKTDTLFTVIKSEIKRIIVPGNNNYTIVNIPYITIQLEFDLISKIRFDVNQVVEELEN